MEVLEQPNFDLLNSLRSFLSGATRSSRTCDLELTRNALALLKTLPASRDAVLEYFCSVFDSAVKKYSSQVQVRKCHFFFKIDVSLRPLYISQHGLYHSDLHVVYEACTY